MKIQDLDGQTYTEIDEQTFQDSDGGLWVLAEREDMISKIRWAQKTMTRLAGRIAQDWDAACEYDEAAGIKAETEEDLRIVNELWNL